jgi:tripartite motif-containing protein 2/3/tripartite motif-containing protein 71
MQNLESSKQASHCSVHEGKELELYCESCEKLICLKCAVKGGKHHDHTYYEIHEAFKKFKGKMKPLLETTEERKKTAIGVQEKLEARCGEISEQEEDTAVKIRDTFKELRKELDARETELIGQLKKINKDKLKHLKTQTDQIEKILAEYNNSSLHPMKEIDEIDVLMRKSNIEQKLEELATPFQPGILEPCTEADTEFLAADNMTALCQNYGEILSSGPPGPSKCDITGKGAQVAAVGETSTAILKACDSEGTPCKGPIEALKCEVMSERTDTRASCSVERRGQSQYEISYLPTIKGRHLLHVKVEGQHVRGSPFPIAVKSSIEKLGTPVLTIRGVTDSEARVTEAGVTEAGPWGVAINKRGEVVVAESGGHCVSVFSPRGEKLELQPFGEHGSGPGQLHRPREIAFDGEGNILVVDHGNHRIQKFTPGGQLLTSVGTRGSKPRQFLYPTGIAFNTSNSKWYVTDNDNHRIQVLNSDLTFSSTFGSKGDGRREFIYPTGIACDSTGKVYVADTHNHRIQVLTANGKFLRMFGGFGQGEGELNNPIGVAISDMVYVCEDINCRVSVFTLEGKFVKSFGRIGKEPGCFEGPRGLAVDSSGVVYVCDKGNNRVQLF